MKSKQTTAFSPKKFLLPPLFGFFVLGRAHAQQQTIQPLAPPVESISELNMTNSFHVFGPHPNASAPTPYEPFSWDQFYVRPHGDYQFTDAQGLLAAPSNHVNTLIQNISPGVLVNLGPHWAFDYTLTIGLYSNTNFTTAYNHAITLTGETVYTDWIFGFQQSADLSKSPLIEAGGQTDQDTYTTVVTGHHEDSQYVTEDLDVVQSILFSGGGFEDTRSWTTLDWLNYQPQSRFSLGIGPGLGYENADFGPDSVFEQGQARVNWRATEKLSFQISGGVQETEFLGGNSAPNLFSPIYGATIQYQPFSQTQISAYANRSVSPSIFVGEYTELTTFGVSFSQRLLGQFNFAISGNYNDQRYVASIESLIPARTDKFYSLSVRLYHSFLDRGTASIYYEYGRDDSTLPGYSFLSNQYGIEVSYSF